MKNCGLFAHFLANFRWFTNFHEILNNLFYLRYKKKIFCKYYQNYLRRSSNKILCFYDECKLVAVIPQRMDGCTSPINPGIFFQKVVFSLHWSLNSRPDAFVIFPLIFCLLDQLYSWWEFHRPSGSLESRGAYPPHRC